MVVHNGSFPNCCGIIVIYGHNGVYNTALQLTDNQKKEILADLKVRIADSTSVGLLLIAINSDQMKTGLGAVFEEAGFKDLTGPCFHPGHGRKITLFGYETHPKHRDEKEEPFGGRPKEMIREVEKVKAEPEKKSTAGLFTQKEDVNPTAPLRKPSSDGYFYSQRTGRLLRYRPSTLARIAREAKAGLKKEAA